MLKFTEIEEENIEKVCKDLFFSDDYADEVLNSFDFSDPDVSYAVAYSNGCMLVRICDYGRYFFVYPIELFEDFDIGGALLEISEYVKREEIPLVFTDVSSEGISAILSLGFKHLDVDFEGDDSYRVRIKTECDLISEDVSFSYKDICLATIEQDDTMVYAELCRDEELNKFWGYDYKEDAPNASDEYFYVSQKEGKMLGTSMSLAVKQNGIFVGEVQLFAFDARGGCELAVRIARKYQGKGLGSQALEASVAFLKTVGIERIFCDVMKDNLASISLFNKYFEQSESSDETRVRFVCEL